MNNRRMTNFEKTKYITGAIGFVFMTGLMLKNMLTGSIDNNQNGQIERDEVLNFFLPSFVMLVNAYVFDFYKPPLRAIKHSFRMWREEQETNASEEIISDFENLSNEQKEMLFQQGLVNKDEAQKYSLKFICPISLGLINKGGCLRVGENDFDVFDLTLIKELLSRNPEITRSPATQKPLIDRKIYTDVEIDNDIKQYKKDLKEGIKRLKILENKNKLL